jgi:hypothetical protein
MIIQTLTRVKSKLACSIFAKIRPHWAGGSALIHRSDFRLPLLAELVQYSSSNYKVRYSEQLPMKQAKSEVPGCLGREMKKRWGPPRPS